MKYIAIATVNNQCTGCPIIQEGQIIELNPDSRRAKRWLKRQYIKVLPDGGAEIHDNKELNQGDAQRETPD